MKALRWFALGPLFLLSSHSMAIIDGEPAAIDSVIKIGNYCTGVFINNRYVLTSRGCVQTLQEYGGSIIDRHGHSFSVVNVYARQHSRVHNIVSKNSAPDLGIVEVNQDFHHSYSAVFLSRTEAESVWEDAGGRYRPDLETLQLVSYGPTQLTSSFGQQNRMAINFRYQLDSNYKESVFGSRFIKICLRDEGSPVLDSNFRVIGVLSRPLMTDENCGSHEGWIVSNTFSSDAKDFLEGFVGANPGQGQGQDGQGDGVELYSESPKVDLCKRGFFCSEDWQSDDFMSYRKLQSFSLFLEFDLRRGAVKVIVRDQEFMIDQPTDVNRHTIEIKSLDFLDTDSWYAGSWNIKLITEDRAEVRSVRFVGVPL